MVKLEIFARDHIIPNQRLVFTPRMRDHLFIMVCRHIAYGGTINNDIDDPADHPPSDQDDVPPLIDYPYPVPAPVVADLPGKRPRDDPSA